MAAIDLPDGLIDIAVLGIASEAGDVANDENLADLADLIIRCTGVLIRHAAQRPEWTATDIPYEVRVVAINFARRVFNNPQNQQRIQTGPLGESYHPDELTGMALKDSEEALLATFAEEEVNENFLGIVQVVRPDPLPFRRGYPRDVGVGVGIGRGDYRVSLPSFTGYLGVDNGDTTNWA